MSITVPATFIPAAYIDLATLRGSPLEDMHTYSLNNATTYFMREVKQCTPFTQIPVIHNNHSGQPAFGELFSVVISRSGDYLTNSWLRVTIPEVTLLDTNPHGADGRIRWTKNLMHNLIADACLYFVDTATQQFDSFFLDFWAAFTISASKRNGYDIMIGNVDDLIRPHGPNDPLKSRTLNLPLPFFFSRDTGLALPTGALLYTETKISLSFRNWQQLLILENANPEPGEKNASIPEVGSSLERPPVLQNVTVWGNFIITEPVERTYIGSCSRNLLIEQIKYAPKQTYEPVNNPNKPFDMRFSHAIKLIFFGVRNNTFPNIWSNWSTASPVINDKQIQFEPSGAYDPINDVTIHYESSPRLSNIGADYFSYIQPYYHAPAIPDSVGYHMYSYALDITSVEPNGSTNYGRLSNINMVPNASAKAKEGFLGRGPPGSGMDYPQSYEFVIIVVSQNILNISGGTVAYPVM